MTSGTGDGWMEISKIRWKTKDKLAQESFWMASVSLSTNSQEEYRGFAGRRLVVIISGIYVGAAGKENTKEEHGF